MALAPINSLNPGAYATSPSSSAGRQGGSVSSMRLREGANFAAGKGFRAGLGPGFHQRSMEDLQRRGAQQTIDFRNNLMKLLGFGSDGKGLAALIGGAPDTNSLALLDKYGEGERGRITQDSLDRERSALAEAQSRGLASSSFLSTIPTGFQKEKNLSLGELGDRVIGQKVGVIEKGADRQVQLANILAQLLGGLV